MDLNCLLDESAFLFMNRTGREKLSKVDVDINNDSADIVKYKEMILEFTEKKLNSDEETENILDNIFQTYINQVIHHFKQKETESANLYNASDLESEEETVVNEIPTKSFWGKHKVIKK